MIGAAELALLRPTSVLINVSRETIHTTQIPTLSCMHAQLHSGASSPCGHKTLSYL
jgi:hypothetical protein